MRKIKNVLYEPGPGLTYGSQNLVSRHALQTTIVMVKNRIFSRTKKERRL
jgi:hypothetical protein